MLWNHHNAPFAALEWLETHPYTGTLWQRVSDGAITLSAIHTPEAGGLWDQLHIADLRHWCSFQKEAQARFRETMADHNAEVAERAAMEDQLQAARKARIANGTASQRDHELAADYPNQTLWH
jgi:hypothetical protein